jgi:hypothetical protein
MELRRSLVSSGDAPSRFAFAIAFLRIVYVYFSRDFYLSAKKAMNLKTTTNYLDQTRVLIWDEFQILEVWTVLMPT